MVDPSAISDLESAAADLGTLLSGWTHRLAEAETAATDHADPEARPEPPGLATINDGIQALWRLVSVQKSIQQLKTPTPENKSLPGDDARRAAPSTDSPDRQSSIANRQSPASPAFHSSPFTLQSSVPSVPSVPAFHSIDVIVDKTEKLFEQTVNLMAQSGLTIPGSADLQIGDMPQPTAASPVLPEPAPVLSGQSKPKLLDMITARPMFPGSGDFFKSLRADLVTSPP